MWEGEKARSPMRCVHCGAPITEVYVQYSPGNIRLTKCGECKHVADEYVECEMMIILIDLILHKPEAYRHLFFNYPNLNQLNLKELIWKAGLLFLILDSYKQSILGAGKDAIKWESLSAFVLSSGKLMALVGMQNVVFLSTMFFASRLITRKGYYLRLRCRDLLLAWLLSSYFKLFTFAMMVWDFSPFMIHIIEMFVLSSNTVAFKVMVNATTTSAVIIIVASVLMRSISWALLHALR